MLDLREPVALAANHSIKDTGGNELGSALVLLEIAF